MRHVIFWIEKLFLWLMLSLCGFFVLEVVVVLTLSARECRSGRMAIENTTQQELVVSAMVVEDEWEVPIFHGKIAPEETQHSLYDARGMSSGGFRIAAHRPESNVEQVTRGGHTGSLGGDDWKVTIDQATAHFDDQSPTSLIGDMILTGTDLISCATTKQAIKGLLGF